ncbi:MAG: RNA-binding S4 domain-containing protein [Flavobacteriales bacterium]|nr:RNA-binding S4 domain-containing protein [Flavobacteriales bacterium]
MNETPFALKGNHIMLTSLLKASNIGATGGHAGLLILEGEVKVNGEVEHRKRRKLRVGDRVEVFDQMIIIV